MPSSLNRRDLLKLGAASTALNALGGAAPPADAVGQHQSTSPRVRSGLHTPLCDLLDIRTPVLQAPMPGLVTPDLVAEMARAGGLGFYAGTGMPPEELRKQIRRIRELTDGPFGVNLILHPALRSPLRPDQIASDMMQAIQRVLDGFRERLGLPAGSQTPPALPAMTDEAFAVVLEEHVPVFSAALGLPTPEMMSRCRAQGTRVVAMVTTVPDALEAAALGVDAIIAQGSEAGGHRSTWIKRQSPEMAGIGTMALVPQIVDAVRVPVIAAGGISNGRQLVASLTLGASGVLMGTRFIATRESSAPTFYKRAIVERGSDDTTISDAFTGLYARVLRTEFTEEYRASGAPVLPIVQLAISQDITAASAKRGTGEYFPMYAGQGLGMIGDIPTAAAVMESVVAEAEQALAELGRRRDPR